MAAETFIALLRGINVGGRNRLPMAELRSLCEGLGWSDVESYVQSGNLVCSADAEPTELEAALEEALRERIGARITVFVRTAAEWSALARGNPFPGAAETEPNLVMLALAKAPPEPGSVERLAKRAGGGERVARVDDALWIHYAGGAGRSKIGPGALERLLGTPVTTRNWRTVRKLEEMAARD